MTKKLNTNLDFDFGDISKPNTQSLQKQRKKSNKKDSILNIPLSIPITGSSNKFITKTISQCSAKEFSHWSNVIAYPVKSEMNHYSNPKNRLDHFMKALAYHKRNFMVANPKTYQTFH